jgi:hypothetical protein
MMSCTPSALSEGCRKQQPELDALAVCFALRGVIFIGVDIRDDRANAAAYAREFRAPYPGCRV